MAPLNATPVLMTKAGSHPAVLLAAATLLSALPISGQTRSAGGREAAHDPGMSSAKAEDWCPPGYGTRAVVHQEASLICSEKSPPPGREGSYILWGSEEYPDAMWIDLSPALRVQWKALSLQDQRTLIESSLEKRAQAAAYYESFLGKDPTRTPEDAVRKINPFWVKNVSFWLGPENGRALAALKSGQLRHRYRGALGDLSEDDWAFLAENDPDFIRDRSGELASRAREGGEISALEWKWLARHDPEFVREAVGEARRETYSDQNKPPPGIMERIAAKTDEDARVMGPGQKLKRRARTPPLAFDKKRRDLIEEIVSNVVIPEAEGAAPPSQETVAEMIRLLEVQLRRLEETVLENMIGRNVRFFIIPRGVAYTDIPPFTQLKGLKTPMDGTPLETALGVANVNFVDENGRQASAVAVPEENLFATVADGTVAEDLVAHHEAAHAVHSSLSEGGFERHTQEIERLYWQRLDRKLPFTDTYAATNPEEYFAQASTIWFLCPGTGAGNRTIGWLKKNDPGLYNILYEIYGPPKKSPLRCRKRRSPEPAGDPP